MKTLTTHPRVLPPFFSGVAFCLWGALLGRGHARCSRPSERHPPESFCRETDRVTPQGLLNSAGSGLQAVSPESLGFEACSEDAHVCVGLEQR